MTARKLLKILELLPDDLLDEEIRVHTKNNCFGIAALVREINSIDKFTHMGLMLSDKQKMCPRRKV